jgi:hypothetical protein
MAMNVLMVFFTQELLIVFVKPGVGTGGIRGRFHKIVAGDWWLVEAVH